MPHRQMFDTEADFRAALRDWFAGQALAGMSTWAPYISGQSNDLTEASVLRRRAEWAYAQTDAMLAARSKP